MINLRYHIVSIIAVFLALGVGIAVGASLIEGVTVSTLESRLEDLETRLEQTDEDNAGYLAELELDQRIEEELGEVGAALLLDGRLVDQPVVLFTADGVETRAIEGVQGALAASGAAFSGTYRTTDRLTLSTVEDRNRMAELLGTAENDPDTLRRLLVERLGVSLAEIAEPAPVTTTTTTTAAPAPTAPPPTIPPGVDPPPPPVTGVPVTTVPPVATTTPIPLDPDTVELFAALVFNGFLAFEPGPSGGEAPLPPAGAGFVFLHQAGAVPAAEEFFLPLLRELSAAEAPVLVAADSSAEIGIEPEQSDDASDAAPDDDSGLVPTIRDSALGESVSTVDTAVEFVGWTAIVLAVEAQANGTVGAYGLGPGAEQLLPTPT